MLAFAFRMLLSLACIGAPSEALLLSRGTSNISTSYDYIIVGGGLTGLVVANRLSEDPDVTVLVLEAGEPASQTEAVTVPGLIGHGWDPSYIWNLTTTPQESLDNQTRPYPVGHVLGGATIINGLVMTRGAKADYDAWERLGNEGWAWRDMLPYFIKSETLTLDLDNATLQDYHISPDLTTHGTKGPVEVTYPRFMYNQSLNFLQGAAELGLPLVGDLNSGVSAGAMIVPASISAQNRSRVDSRTAYLGEEVIDRPNLHVATGCVVTKILLDDKGSAEGIAVPEFGHLKRAWGVEFIASSSPILQTVNASKEVLLAAGAVLSPALLQASGIGPAALLQDLGIPVQVNLPGVGQNLQDHGMVSGKYNYTQPGLFSTKNLTGDTLRQVQDEYFLNHTGPWTAPMISTVAFPSLQALFSNDTGSVMLEGIRNSLVESYLPPDTHPFVKKGYSQQRDILLEMLRREDVAALEIMADSIGTLTVSTHHPFSRGSVQITTANPFINGSSLVGSNIQVNPRYCSAQVDCDIMIAGLEFNSKLMNTSALRELMPNPQDPWTIPLPSPLDGSPGLGSESLLQRAVSTSLRTEFHPCGTTSMMPLELGGVVNPRLVVYGTSNLRVVDAGVIPLIPAAHLQAGLYALAERAADLIKEDGCIIKTGTGSRNNSNCSPVTSAPATVATGSSPRRRPPNI
ncbi:putative GMC oxidoreductase [Naviculisporaceae sp. PSN 640]